MDRSVVLKALALHMNMHSVHTEHCTRYDPRTLQRKKGEKKMRVSGMLESVMHSSNDFMPVY